jgi:hypothetical protein
MGSSAAGKHHASQQAHSTKRKEPPADPTPPKSKKAAASVRKSDHVRPSDDAQQALRERHRQAVSALYTAYDQLCGTSKDEASDAAAYNTLLDGAKGGPSHQHDQQCINLMLPYYALAPQCTVCAGLLPAACCSSAFRHMAVMAEHAEIGLVPHAGGTCAQRVAARLIPRFAHRFPQKLEQAAAALISITGSHSSTKDPDGVRALSKVSMLGTCGHAALMGQWQYISAANVRSPQAASQCGSC